MNEWLQQFKEKLLKQFGQAIQFIGLQGSRSRNEGNEESDIDVVVIFDELTIDKLKAYEAIANTMPDRHLLCGFVGGIGDLQSWDKADLFTFMYDTTSLYGDISSFKTMITAHDVKKFIRGTAGNVYHMTLHNYLHSKSEDMIQGLYKSARFAIQGNVFIEKNEFISLLHELPTFTNECDTKVIQRFIDIKEGSPVHVDNDTENLFNWAKETLRA